MYCSETWTLTPLLQRNIEATEMWFFRRMLRVSYKDKISNETILLMSDSNRSIVNRIRTRQARFLGHVMRRKGLEHLLVTGSLCGKKDKGRPRLRLLDGLARWCGMDRVKRTTLLRMTDDREAWKSIVSNATLHGTWMNESVVFWWICPAFEVNTLCLQNCAI